MKMPLPLAIILAVVLLLGFGCTRNITGKNLSADQVTVESGHDGTLASDEQLKVLVEKGRNIYKIQETQYALVDSGNENTDRGTKAVSNKPDTLNGKPARLGTEEVDLSIGSISSSTVKKIWLDSKNRCLKETFSVNGGSSEIEETCPGGEWDYYLSLTKDNRVYYEGEETVVVPFGTYPAKRYNLGIPGTYWISDGIPVPLKITKGTITQKLVTYTS